MTSTQQTEASLLGALSKQAPSLGFVEAVRYLCALAPQSGKPGQRRSFSTERITFRHNSSLGIGSGDIAKIEHNGDTVVVQANPLGLSGEASPLPQFMFESLAIDDPDQERAREYLDIFHHRLYSLLFRGLNELHLEHQTTNDPTSNWLDRLTCLLGIDLPQRETLQHLDRRTLLRLAPVLSGRTKSKRSIEQGVNHLLEPFLIDAQGNRAVATIHDFEGTKSQIEEQELLKLGKKNHQLGQKALIGLRVKHRAAKARIKITPLHPSQQENFEPGAIAYNQLGEFLALCTQTPIDYDLDLRVKYRSKDHCTLGRSRLKVNAVLPGPNTHRLRRIVSKLNVPLS